MLKWLKLSQHHHSGRLRPHENTSYLPLGFLLLITGLSLIFYTASAVSPPPQSSSIGLSGQVPAAPPTTAATIKEPADQKHFSQSPVTFSGSCPTGTLVELYKNNIFAGSTTCSDTGSFSMDVDLLIGQNVFVARVYDALNQAGPDSNNVTVFYDLVPTQGSSLSSLSFSGNQLLLNTDAVFRGTFPSQELSLPVEIIGGTPPFAVNIQWGDSTNKVVSRNDNTSFRTGHAYQKAGTYQISIQVSDATGRVAFISVAAIVNGQPSVVSSTTPASIAANGLLVLWPLYTAVFAVVVSFWLGEKREKGIYNKRGMMLPS